MLVGPACRPRRPRRARRRGDRAGAVRARARRRAALSSTTTSTSTSARRAREDAAALVAPGDAGVWHGEPLELPNGRFVSKALDDRLGAYAVLEAARRVAADGGAARRRRRGRRRCRRRSATTAPARRRSRSSPTVAIAVDVTWATDVPGGDPKRAGKVELGSGAAITRGPGRQPRASPTCSSTAAEEEGIPHTIEVCPGADAYRRRRRPRRARRRPDRARLDPAPLHALARARSRRSTTSRR